MINQGVPVHIVQYYLGHATPQMTNVYAHLHDQTMRTAFEEYASKRVNIAGQALPITPNRRPPTPSGSSTTWPASPTACPTATAAGLPSATVPTPMPV